MNHYHHTLSTHPRVPYRAFSMIEVAVVVAIVSILMAIAIPLLSGPSDSGSNRTAQAAIMLAYESQRIAYKSSGGYTSSAYVLEEHAPEVTFNGPSTPSTSPMTVSVAVQTGVDDQDAMVGMAALSNSGVCWMLLAVPHGDTRGTAYARDESPGATGCTGLAALSITQPTLSGAGESWQRTEQVQ